MTHEASGPLGQVNKDGGTGFIGGQHTHTHNYPSTSGAVDAVQASIEATSRGDVVGPSIDGWDPKALGVHASITVNDETTLTPYLPRPHDQQLRESLAALRSPDASARLILVVGSSCTGKTRTFYEAIRDVLPDWQLTAARTDTDLASLITGGVPARTVVWLDQLQDRLTNGPDGVTAAKAIHSLLDTAEVGPILFAGTIWPANQQTMLQRPTPGEARTGAGAITDLIRTATVCDVPDSFTDDDLAAVHDGEDPRLQLAAATAAKFGHPEQGRKITQLLAGGSQLVHRLHPPSGIEPPDKFNAGARAILLAAGDLRRIGMPNPIPRWALDGAAPGYLDPPTTRPAGTWLKAALREATQDADADDPITGIRTLEIHTKGVPALTPNWTTRPDGKEIEAYDLHDFLYQDHLTRHLATPTAHELWETMVTGSDALTEDTAFHVWQSAQQRGLFSCAMIIARSRNGPGNSWAFALTESVAGMQDEEGLRLLQNNSGGLWPSGPLAQLYTARRDKAALLELHLAAHEPLLTTDAAGTPSDIVALSQTFEPVGEEFEERWLHRRELRHEGWWQPTVGASEPTEALLELMIQDGDADGIWGLFKRGVAHSDRALGDLLLRNADETGLRDLVYKEGVEYALARLADLYIDQDRTDDLDNLPDTRDDYVSRERLRYYQRHGDQARLEAALEANPDDSTARNLLIGLFVARGDEKALLKLRETHNFLALHHLADIRRARGDEAGLQELTSYRLPRGHTHEYPLRQWIELLIDLRDETGLRGFRQQGHSQVLRQVVDDRAKRQDLDALSLLTRIDAPGAAETLRSQQRTQEKEHRMKRLLQTQDTTRLAQMVHAATPGAAMALLALLRNHNDGRGCTELDETATLIPARKLFRPSAR